MTKNFAVILFSFFFLIISAQSENLPQNDTITNYSKFLRNTTFNGLLQTRYLVSLTNNVDVNGVNVTDQDKLVDNSFNVKRARFIIKSKINDRFDLGMMLNFAEFNNSNVTGKVLEQAFVRYTHNKHLKIQLGQFRPFFGIEDEIPADFIKSVDFSNGYYLLGKNGWQSYQTGVVFYGDINNAKLPLKYYVGVTNGNSRGLEMDNDKGKHAYARLEKDYINNLKLGVNAGIGSSFNKTGNAIGADIEKIFTINKEWSFEVISEYKEGTNFSEFSTTKLSPKPEIKDFRFRNFYVNPIIRYNFNSPRLRSIEVSSRYEYLNPNYHLNGNVRKTITPMLNVEFADQYFACLQLGAVIDNYEKNIPLTWEYDHSTFFAQVQVRF